MADREQTASDPIAEAECAVEGYLDDALIAMTTLGYYTAESLCERAIEQLRFLQTAARP